MMEPEANQDHTENISEPSFEDRVGQMVTDKVAEAMAPFQRMISQWSEAVAQPQPQSQENPSRGLLELILPHVAAPIMNKLLGVGGGDGDLTQMQSQLNVLASTVGSVQKAFMAPAVDMWRMGVQSGVQFSTQAYRATGEFPDPQQFAANVEPPAPVSTNGGGPASPNLSRSDWRKEVAVMAQRIPGDADSAGA